MSQTRRKKKLNRLVMLNDLCTRAGIKRKHPGAQYLSKEELIRIVCLLAQLDTVQAPTA